MPAPAVEAPATLAVPSFGGTPGGVLSNEVWSVMAGDVTATTTNASGARNARFRLAGTFFVENGDGSIQRKAILDDLGRHEQSIVGEGDPVAEVRVERIFYDHVTLRSGTGTEDVWLDFGRVYAAAAGLAATNAIATNMVASATNRLGGVQLQADRWQFSRQKLLDYYQEVLDEPDRMVAIFDSLKPVRDRDSKITGYVVGVEGEGEFFQAVGLRNGDVVRKVNAVPMTSRRRAEFFIDEFLKDRMNVVVLDVEREGKAAKQVYLVRP
jgi:type II secretory pathway component PulC